jgi:hypothetical protein
MKHERTSTLLLTVKNSDCPVARLLEDGGIDGVMKALRMGYLDNPKRAPLMDIAQVTGTILSTVRRHLESQLGRS